MAPSMPADGALGLVALIEKGTEPLVAQESMRLVDDGEKTKQEGELTAARRLLDEIPSLDNAVVTGDANFCRPDIAQRIVQEKGGDYLLGLRDNNPKLHATVCRAFDGGFPGAQPPLFGKVK